MAFVSYLFGIGVHSLFPFLRLPGAMWLVVVPLVWFVASKRSLFFVLCAFVLGLWRFDVSIPQPQDGVLPWVGEETVFQGRVESVRSFGSGKMVTVRAERVFQTNIRGPGNGVDVAVFGWSAPVIGSRMNVQCLLQTYRETFSTRRDIWAECHGSSFVDVISPPDRFDVLATLSAWHGQLTTRITSLFPPDEGTLITGVLYGDQQLSVAQRDLMQRSGLMHIVAVSGSNVTIVVSVLMTVILACGFRRRYAFYVATIGIIAFTLFVGSSSSVVRAAIMGWLVLFARHVGRAPKPSRMLLLSAVGLSTVNPWVLGFDAGFALSFLATWGLMIWTPLISVRVPWIPERFGLREAFSTTSGATIMTLPYLGWFFGRMSLAGLFTNMLALPLVPFIMLWGAVAAVVGPAFPLLTIPAYGFTVLVERVAHLTDLVPFLDVRLEKMDFTIMIGLYTILAWSWYTTRKIGELSTKT